jgi:hypothetical protein
VPWTRRPNRSPSRRYNRDRRTGSLDARNWTRQDQAGRGKRDRAEDKKIGSRTETYRRSQHEDFDQEIAAGARGCRTGEDGKNETDKADPGAAHCTGKIQKLKPGARNDGRENHRTEKNTGHVDRGQEKRILANKTAACTEPKG